MRRSRPTRAKQPLAEQTQALAQGRVAVTVDPRVRDVLVISAQAVSARLAGEYVTCAALRNIRSPTAALAGDEVGVLESSLDGLGRSRRRSAMKVQPELRRALATRAVNAAGVYLASQFVYRTLALRHDDLTVPDFGAAVSRRAQTAIAPFVADRRIGGVVCGLIMDVDGCEDDPSRWRAVVAVAQLMLDNGARSTDVDAMARAWLPDAPDQPLARLRHPRLQPLLDCLSEPGTHDDRTPKILELAEAHRDVALGVLERKDRHG